MGLRLKPRRTPYVAFNPTWLTVETAVDRMGDGQEYIIKQGEELEIYDQYHAKHIEEHNKEDGIVLLDYDKEAESKYGSYESYRLAKGIEGLKNFHNKYSVALEREKGAKKEAIKDGSQVDISSTNVTKFEAILKQIELAIATAGGQLDRVFDKEVKPSMPTWLKKDEVTESNLETKPEINVKMTENGRYMINGKFASKEQVEELGIESGGIKNKD